MPIIQIKAYCPGKEEYVDCDVSVNMQAYGINSWDLLKVDGKEVMDQTFEELGIEPITFDEVDAAARWQLRGGR